MIYFEGFSQFQRTDSISNFPSYPICYEINGDKMVWSPDYRNSEKCVDCTLFWININNFFELQSRAFYENASCKSLKHYKLVLSANTFLWIPHGVWREFDKNGEVLSEEFWTDGVSTHTVHFKK